LENTVKTGFVLAASSRTSFPFSQDAPLSKNAIYDILIKGGTIYDGTLTEPVTADLGIIGDRIVELGKIEGKALRTIDASGLIVTPGFIDVHTHCDLYYLKYGSDAPSFRGNTNFVYQGVTTVVDGNCGLGTPDTTAWLNWVNSLKFGTNSYHLAPHGAIRQKLFGEQQPEELNSSQLDALKGKITESMEAGAVGLSTGLAYSPGFLARTREIIELAKVARMHGGIYATHIRDESGRDYGQGKRGVIEALNEAIEIGKRAEIPVQISHLKLMAPFNKVSANQILEIIDRARGEGLDITADQYPYDFSSTFISILLPNEFVAKEGIKETYKTPEGKRAIQRAIENVFSYLGPEKILISMFKKNTSYEGKTLREIAAIEGRQPAESFADMASEDEVPMGLFFNQDMKIVREIMPRDYVMTGSDGWTVLRGVTRPHPRCYGTFPRKIRKFVLEEKILNLASALRSMTSLPAQKFKIRGRGRIAKGHYADVAVFDLKTIRDRATYLDPHQYAEGIQVLLVNGIFAIEKGVATGERGGRGLRRA